MGLVHQDINGGNLLSSKNPSGTGWVLDAIIDWESAVVVDPRLAECRDEPWCTAQLLGTAAKGAHLAGCFAIGALPRCELESSVEDYTEAAQELAEKGLLSFQPWSRLVERCKGMASCQNVLSC